jgi:hypothetical protein
MLPGGTGRWRMDRPTALAWELFENLTQSERAQFMRMLTEW